MFVFHKLGNMYEMYHTDVYIERSEQQKYGEKINK